MMNDLWRRIEAWLTDNAPDIRDDLASGADEEALGSLEETIGTALPEDVRASFRVHDGQSGGAPPLLGEWELLSLRDVDSQWQIQKGLYDDGEFDGIPVTTEGPVREEWWIPEWVPVLYNGAGDLYCLDLSPPDGGTEGQVVTVWHVDDRREVVAPSFRALLSAFADDLEGGRYTVEDGRLVRTSEE